jgi:branched-chain amino acid transport system substrate-binding protein
MRYWTALFVVLFWGQIAWAEGASAVRVLTLLEPPQTQPTLDATGIIGINLILGNDDQFQLRHVRASKNLSELAQQLAEEIESFKPDVIIGGSTSNAAFVISDFAEKKGIPFLAPLATHQALTDNKKFTYRVCFDDEYQAAEMARFIVQEKNLKRGLVLFNTTQVYSIGFKKIFETEAKKLGAQVQSAGFETERDLTESLLKGFSPAEIDFVVLPSYEMEAVAILSRLLKIFPKTTLYFGPDSWGGADLIWRSFEAAKEKMPEAYFFSHWAEANPSTPNQNFVKRLRDPSLHESLQAYSGMVGSGVALSHDAALAVREAHKLRQKEAGLSWNEAFQRLQFEGATGTLNFRNANLSKTGVHIFRVSTEGPKFYRSIASKENR